MAEKSIIIIGAGLAGLSTGCYAQMNGYKTQIFELHNLPGGCVRVGSSRGILSMDVFIFCRAPVPASSSVSMKSWGQCKADAWLTTKSSYASKGLEERP